jgi:D-alanyl-D-alanine carboxypeptidase/D-alanyl-D-alanine-endopeptidase (penicillin-binding protein 4)
MSVHEWARQTASAKASAAALVLALGATAIAGAPADRDLLRRELNAVLAAPILARSHWSIAIKSLDRGDVILEHNPGKLVMPASNMKIFTMAATAERLGWDYRFETTLESAAPIAGGVLQGDLIVRGSGDPTISHRDDVATRTFDEWAAALRARGITGIAGRIIGNDAALDDEELGFGWSWDDLAYGYAAPVTALVYNEALIRLNARPGARPGDPALIEVVPDGDHGLTIVNHATTGASDEPETLDVRRVRGSTALEVIGRVPAGSERLATLTAAVENPTLFFARALRSALISRGISVGGDAMDLDLLPAHDPAHAAASLSVLATHRSAPLTDIGRTFMQVSQNLYGELLLKAVGRSAGLGTTARGQQAVAETLTSWGMAPDSYILADGSGLSRMNYVSAEAVLKILDRMHSDPKHREPFFQALPVGGRNGTLRNRLRASWTAGNVHAKTGSITNARALSGFVRSRSGETFAFSIIANNFSLPAWRIERVIDLLVEILAK